MPTENDIYELNRPHIVAGFADAALFVDRSISVHEHDLIDARLVNAPMNERTSPYLGLYLEGWDLFDDYSGLSRFEESGL